jgi:hypothetical protein
MRTWSFIFVVVVGFVGVGCGDDGGGTTDSSTTLDSATGGDSSSGDTGGGGDTTPPGDGGGDTGGGGDDDSGAPGDGGPTDAAPIDAEACMGAHPEVEGDMRFCLSGACYCRESDTMETCYPAAVAARCCSVDVVCAP